MTWRETLRFYADRLTNPGGEHIQKASNDAEAEITELRALVGELVEGLESSISFYRGNLAREIPGTNPHIEVSAKMAYDRSLIAKAKEQVK